MKTASNNPVDAIMKMARKTGVVRAREIRNAGLHPEYLRKLCRVRNVMQPYMETIVA
jgi:hypothetical protein